jgi:hypothetical protein
MSTEEAFFCWFWPGQQKFVDESLLTSVSQEESMDVSVKSVTSVGSPPGSSSWVEVALVTRRGGI